MEKGRTKGTNARLEQVSSLLGVLIVEVFCYCWRERRAWRRRQWVIIEGQPALLKEASSSAIVKGKEGLEEGDNKLLLKGILHCWRRLHFWRLSGMWIGSFFSICILWVSILCFRFLFCFICNGKIFLFCFICSGKIFLFCFCGKLFLFCFCGKLFMLGLDIAWDVC